MVEWKGTPDPYVFYENIDQVPLKLLKIIETYGCCFDDEWYYWKPKPRKNRLAAATTIKKIKVCYGPQKRIPAEKHTAKEHPKVPIDQW